MEGVTSNKLDEPGGDSKGKQKSQSASTGTSGVALKNVRKQIFKSCENCPEESGWKNRQAGLSAQIWFEDALKTANKR